MIRKIVYYSGHVQGVGFRYTAREIAGGYAVSGYVRNLSDGRVELVVEGESGQVDAMLDEMAATMKQHIRKTTMDRSMATGEFGGFAIRY